MRILWVWVPWVPYQRLGSFQEPSVCMPLTEPKESFAETPETGVIGPLEGSCPSGMKTKITK